MVQGKDNNNSSSINQSDRPSLSHQDSPGDSQVSSDHTSVRPQHHRSKSHQKHVVVGGSRLHARVPSSKALHKHHATASSTKVNSRRHASPSPERPDHRPATSSTHRRATSDLKLSRDSSSSNLGRISSHASLKRNRSHVEVPQRNSSSEKLKRSSSHKEVSKLKAPKGTVHFDLGNDGEDEWVDASGSASPYLSRRGSVTSGGQGSVPTPPRQDNSQPQTPPTDSSAPGQESPHRDTAQHNEYLTSRLLQRTPSYGAPPKMSAETVSVTPRHQSPHSFSRDSSAMSETPLNANLASGSAKDEFTSRFVSGPSSGGAPGSFYSPTPPTAPSRRGDAVRRQRSLGDLQREAVDSSMPDDEDDSALAPRVRRSGYRAPPAEKSRTQQKLNLQRASSTIEPQQTVGGVGASGVNPLVGGGGYDNRDPRISKLVERTGMEYLVVRRYQNPIARSIARVAQLPGADKKQPISQQNGRNGAAHGRMTSELGATNRTGLSQSLRDREGQQQATTPRRTQSIIANGASSSYEAEADRLHERTNGSDYMGRSVDGSTEAILRNLWEKSMDLSASQD